MLEKCLLICIGQCNLVEEKYQYVKNMSINTPGSFHTMRFATFCHAMGNCRGNPRISHLMKFANIFL